MRTISGHDTQGTVIWMTGLSGAGKTTLAQSLRHHLLQIGTPSCVLDGDEIRKGLNSDLGFSIEDRIENNRRVAETAKLISNAGITVIVALISPYDSARRKAREIVTQSASAFLEVFVDTPLSVCEERDPKGYYQRARAQQMRDFTGIQSVYETPSSPDVVVHPAKELLTDSVEKVMKAMRALQPRTH